MTIDNVVSRRSPRRGRRMRATQGLNASNRKVNYSHLKNPFPVMDVFSLDEIANMHDSALRILEEYGIKVLLPEARKIYAAAGARG
jgi:trimethylamine---corrinoid protein Co-methyltransferase